MNVRDTMCRMTYVVEHNPNCKSRFLVRLTGIHKPTIDKKNVSKTKDILGYGDSFIEASRHALNEKERLNKKPIEFIWRDKKYILKRWYNYDVEGEFELKNKKTKEVKIIKNKDWARISNTDKEEKTLSEYEEIEEIVLNMHVITGNIVEDMTF